MFLLFLHLSSGPSTPPSFLSLLIGPRWVPARAPCLGWGLRPHSPQTPGGQGHPQIPGEWSWGGGLCRPAPAAPQALPSGQREKKRVLFLYNELLHKRQAFVRLQGRRIARHARRHQAFEKPLLERFYLWWPRLRRSLPRYCVLCGSPASPQCPTPTCGTTYCQSCWRDMGQICFACTPGRTPLPGDSSSEEQMTYAD
ncbi:unnamed protein product [Lepidochelys kempii]